MIRMGPDGILIDWKEEHGIDEALLDPLGMRHILIVALNGEYFLEY